MSMQKERDPIRRIAFFFAVMHQILSEVKIYSIFPRYPIIVFELDYYLLTDNLILNFDTSNISKWVKEAGAGGRIGEGGAKGGGRETRQS